MDERSEHEMTKEKRSLLNAGHGPPVRLELPMTFEFYSNTANTPTTSVFHRNATYSDFGSHMLTSSGFYRDPRYHPPFTNGPEIADELIWVQKQKEKDLQLQKLSNELHLMRASSGKKVYGDLVRQNDELQQQLTAKVFELESLKAKLGHDSVKYQHLKKLLKSLPDIPNSLPDTGVPDDFIHLIASGDLTSGDNMTDRVMNLDGQVEMMKSVQCSEPSMEQVIDEKEEFNEVKIASPSIQKKGDVVLSPASSASFEVVGQGSCLGSPVEREDMNIPIVNIKAEVEALRSEVDELARKLEAEREERTRKLEAEREERTRKLEAEREERKRENAELKKRMDQISQREEKDSGKALEVIPEESEDERQNVSELMSANWKITEQNLELTRENEDLKKKELEWRSAVSVVSKLQEELLREQRRVIDAEEQLEAQYQHIQELEARIRELEHMRLAESSEQKGMTYSGRAGDLATENAVLKHQIEAYKEDFDVERKDREKLVAQKDTLQRCYDILRSDLDVAREHLKKYENDITMLRIDNNTLRTRLRSVTEEVDALKEGRQLATSTPKAGPPSAQNRTVVSKVVPENTFAQQKPSPPPSAWECQACTYKNPAPRTFCEMCGTHEPLRVSSAAQVPNCSYVPNIPNRELPPVQRNVAQPATSLLSNLRNYGDIETD